MNKPVSSWYLQIWVWTLGTLIDTWVSLLLGSPVDSGRIYICMSTHAYRHLLFPVHLCIKEQFILMLTLQCHRACGCHSGNCTIFLLLSLQLSRSFSFLCGSQTSRSCKAFSEHPLCIITIGCITGQEQQAGSKQGCKSKKVTFILKDNKTKANPKSRLPENRTGKHTRSSGCEELNYHFSRFFARLHRSCWTYYLYFHYILGIA